MDLDHLEKLISKIDLRNETVNGIAEYCIANSKSTETEIANVIQKSFPTYYSERMLAILKLVSEIFMKTSSSPTDKQRFLKPLAAKSKVYIE
jgi:hypothetical protein